MSLNLSPVTLSIVEDLGHTLIYGFYERIGRQKLQIDGRRFLEQLEWCEF